MANPTLLEMPIARDGAKNSIPSTTSPTTGLLSQQYGWQDINSMPVQQGGKAPSRLDFNGVLNLLSNILFYTQKGWQFEWDSSQAYYAGCIVKDTSDGKMYMCLNDVTSTTAPHTDTTNWKVWDLSMLANYLPLSGGAMSGSIKKATDNSALELGGGTDLSHGASLQLFGSAHSSSNAGGLLITTILDDLNYTETHWYPDGRLNHDITTSGTTKTTDIAGSAIVARSMTTNGYVKRASGEIIAWGRSNIGSSSETTISFPVTFTSAPRIVVQILNGTYDHPQICTIGLVETTQFKAKLQNYGLSCDWIAVGY